MKRSRTPLLLVGLLLGAAVLLWPSETYAVTRTAAFDQEHYWWLDDDGALNAATGYDTPDTAQDTSIIDVVRSDTAIVRLRLGILQTTNNANAGLAMQPKLQFSSDASSCTTGTWTDVGTNGSGTAIRLGNTANFTDGDPTTQRFSDGHSFLAGDGVENVGAANSVTYSGPNTEHAEWEWALNITTNATSNTTYRLRAFNNTTGAALGAYSQCAQISTLASFSLEQVSYRWRNDDGGEQDGSQSAGFKEPVSDVSAIWSVTGSTCGGAHWCAVDEGATPDTADFISTGGQGTDELAMDDVPVDSKTYNRIDIRVHARWTGNDQLGVNIVVNGVARTEQVLSLTTTFAWYTVTFNESPVLSASDVNTLQVRLRHVKAGGADSVEVATLRAELFEVVPAATFKQAENTLHTGQAKSQNIRGRFLIKNNGPDSAGARNFRLQWALDTAGTCGSYADVPVTPGGGDPVEMVATSYFVDQDASANISPGLSDPAGTFIAGKLVEDPSNQGSAITLDNAIFSEVEYAISFTSNATDGATYCFRVSRSGIALTSYTQIAKIELAGGGGGPTTEQLLRHGNWFDAGAEQSYFWAD